MMLPINSLKKKGSLVKILLTSMIFCLLLLTVRIVFTGTLLYTFLLWNLFLAVIPFIISSYLAHKSESSLWKLVVLLLIWLLFLPNAPYLLTDLMHLKWGNHGILWFDVLLISTFAWNGLMLCYVSLLDIEYVLQNKLSQRNTILTIVIILFLCGFGIYLGRFLRWNSWDILNNPSLLMKDIAVRFIYPLKYLQTWGVTLGFGTFLNIGFWTFKVLHKTETT